MITMHQAPKTITKTTMKLQPGDVISTGNMYDGFETYTIVDVQPSSVNARRALVVIQFPHGGTYINHEGKNTRWSVIVGEAK